MCLSAAVCGWMANPEQSCTVLSFKPVINELLCVHLYSQKSELLQWLALAWFTLSHLLLVVYGLMPYLAFGMLYSSCYLPSPSLTKSDQSPCFGQWHGGSLGSNSSILAHMLRHRVTVGLPAHQSKAILLCSI